MSFLLSLTFSVPARTKVQIPVYRKDYKNQISVNIKCGDSGTTQQIMLSAGCDLPYYIFEYEGIYKVLLSECSGEGDLVFGFNNWEGAKYLTGVSDYISPRFKYLYSAFEKAENFNDPNVCCWDTSNVVRMNDMFSGARNFNQDISSWDTSKVTNMNCMFSGAINFDQDIGSWDTRNVQNIAYMFYNAVNFNQNLSSWDTSKVTTLEGMFCGAASFNQIISSWDTSKVTTMKRLFCRATSFNQYLITVPNGWNTAKVVDMTEMFDGASSFNQDTSSWNLGSLHYTEHMFRNTPSFTEENRNIFYRKRSELLMSLTFSNVPVGTEIHIPIKKVNKRDNIIVKIKYDQDEDDNQYNRYILCYYSSKVSFKVSYARSPITIYIYSDIGSGDLQFGDYNSYDFKYLTGVGKHISPKFKDLSHMFHNAKIFDDPNICSWDVSNVTNMSCMFYNAKSFNCNLSKWNVSNVTNMSHMFHGAESFDQNISMWDVSKVTDMSCMFNGALSLTTFIFPLTMTKLFYLQFADCSCLTTIVLPEHLNIDMEQDETVFHNTPIEKIYRGGIDFDSILNLWFSKSVVKPKILI